MSNISDTKRLADAIGTLVVTMMEIMGERLKAIADAQEQRITQQTSEPMRTKKQVAEFFVEAVGPHLGAYRIDACRGPGYPDKRLVSLADNRVFAFELKAAALACALRLSRVFPDCWLDSFGVSRHYAGAPPRTRECAHSNSAHEPG